MNNLTVGKLKLFFPNHTLPQVKNFILLITCILHSRTVNLNKCKDYVSNLCKKKSSTAKSNYTRLIRFFKMKDMESFICGTQELLVNLSAVDLTYLIMDRSNWKRGVKNINLLTIGSLCNYVLSPLYWLQLDKGGSSNLTDRKSLIEGLESLLIKSGKSFKGSILLADREFIGQDWFEYLLSKELSFVIRLREKLYFDLQTHTGKKRTSLKSFSKYIEKYGIYSIPMSLGAITYTIVMIKNTKFDPNEPYLYFISDLKDAKAIANHYPKRWKIECYFKHLKTNGFNIEDINLEKDIKIELMMAVLAVLYVIAIIEGILSHKKKPIPIKKYKNDKFYLSESVFRRGLSIIINIFNKLSKLIIYLEDALYRPPIMDSIEFDIINFTENV